jgi:hypothetical protein
VILTVPQKEVLVYSLYEELYMAYLLRSLWPEDVASSVSGIKECEDQSL